MPQMDHTGEQNAAVPRQYKPGDNLDYIFRKLGISQVTFHMWKRHFAGLMMQELRQPGSPRRSQHSDIVQKQTLHHPGDSPCELYLPA
jgi:hypothetical protein